jgi:hypothetical protein
VEVGEPETLGVEVLLAVPVEVGHWETLGQLEALLVEVVE